MKINRNRLKRERFLQGLTLTNVARLAHVATSTVKHLEDGRFKNPPTIKKVADALNIPMDEMIIDDSATGLDNPLAAYAKDQDPAFRDA